MLFIYKLGLISYTVILRNVNLFWNTKIVMFQNRQVRLMKTQYVGLPQENCIRDANTPQPGEIFFNTMRYRSSETVHTLGYFQSAACKD